ncbi:hypothetical protein [Nonlabens dokdonensis]|uniref:hypothetical protein n=1 Tax=Nonlabens dokdonensis TaxID=328515 RepID=UPI0026F0514F|nr:hypothetical protein [Nonlabens dokdonensis]
MKFLMMLAVLLGWSTLPDAVDEKWGFTEEEKANLIRSGYDEAGILELTEDLNKEMKQLEDAKMSIAQLQAAQKAAEAGDDGNLNRDAGDPGGAAAQELTQTDAQLAQMKKDLEAVRAENLKLRKADIPEKTAIFQAAGSKAMHSATHLMGSNNIIDAIENRPWNAAAISGKSISATDWGDQLNVATLAKDAEHYFREDPTVINSLHRDTVQLPSFWNTRYNVTDMVIGASIVTGEVTQGRKRAYIPKNKQAIKTEPGYVFPTNIDLTYIGYELQEMETSWLNAWNKEGTSPYKVSFIQFLLMEVSKQARTEDRIAAIKGVFAPMPDGQSKAGKAIERQNGLLHILWKAYNVDKKFKFEKQSEPTPENIIDHVEGTIRSNLKEDIINEPGLIYYLPFTQFRWYQKAYKLENGTNMDFTGEVGKIDLHPNIKLCPLVDLEGTNLHFITFSNNIELLENRKNEKTLYRFDKLKRDTFIHADYKTGIRMIHIGNKVADGDPAQFKVQSVWTNGQPFLDPNFSLNLYDNTSGLIQLTYSDNRFSDGWATDVTEIKGNFTGEIVKLRGNTTAAAGVAVKDNAQLDLASDWTIKTGGTLYLLVQADGTMKELKRVDASEPTATVKDFDASAIDSTSAKEFQFVGTSAVTLNNILNPIEGDKIKISGNGAAALTINSVGGVIAVNSAAVLDTAGDYIELTVVDGVFTETKRVIAA